MSQMLMAAMKFKPMEFVKSLRYMGEGMLGILIVMLILIGTTYGLNRFFGGKKNK
ncbi:MAG: hypothetical protein IJD35_03110 [Clostridia bacterium]|nr:hypothetical protein [Clostridia bacterium]